MTRRPTPPQWVLIAAVAVPAVVIGGVASGYWNATGGGAGSAGTGAAQLVALEQRQPVRRPFPGSLVRPRSDQWT